MRGGRISGLAWTTLQVESSLATGDQERNWGSQINFSLNKTDGSAWERSRGDSMGRLPSFHHGSHVLSSVMGAMSLFQPGFLTVSNLTSLFPECGYCSRDIYSERQLKNRPFPSKHALVGLQISYLHSSGPSTSLWRRDAATPVILAFASASHEEAIRWALPPTRLLQFICDIVKSCRKSTSCFC